MRLAVFIALVALGIAAIALSVDLSVAAQWAADQQRGFQNQMAGAIMALRSGAHGAWGALLGAAAAYGFVHAVGPGHGKYLIGGVGLGTSVPAVRLVALSVISSLAQALWAIVIVYGGFLALEASAQRMTALAENILAPASALAIAAVGLLLVWRGIRSSAQSRHHHHGDCGCHSHGPSPDQVMNVQSFREAACLVGSIAIRPCTGAIFLLVIAWQMDIRLAGAVAVVVMGLGTAGLTSLVAVSSTAARGLTWASADRLGTMALVVRVLQTLAGGLIILMSMTLLGYRLS